MEDDIIAFVSNSITDTSGAIHMLSKRAGRSYSPETLRYHVQQGNIPAYVSLDAQMVRRMPGESRRGQSYFFLKRDVMALPLDSKAGRKPQAQKKQGSDSQETAKAPDAIDTLPEKTQQQLRDLMEWTETTSVAGVIEKAWQTVKLETFGDPKCNITIKASGPDNAEATIYYPHRSEMQPLGSPTGSHTELSETQKRAYEEAMRYTEYGLMTPARETLEAVFDQVIIEGPGYPQ